MIEHRGRDFVGPWIDGHRLRGRDGEWMGCVAATVYNLSFEAYGFWTPALGVSVPSFFLAMLEGNRSAIPCPFEVYPELMPSTWAELMAHPFLRPTRDLAMLAVDEVLLGRGHTLLGFTT